MTLSGCMGVLSGFLVDSDMYSLRNITCSDSHMGHSGSHVMFPLSERDSSQSRLRSHRNARFFWRTTDVVSREACVLRGILTIAVGLVQLSR